LIGTDVEAVMPPSTTKQEQSETDFDRGREEAFGNEGGAPQPEQDTRSPHPTEHGVARAEDHPEAVRAGVRFPSCRSGYPNNRITFE
jgi:hypothetical protein